MNRVQVGTQHREGVDHRRNYGPMEIELREPEVDGGRPWGKEQWNEWNGFTTNVQQMKNFQIRKQGLAESAKLQNRQGLRRQDVQGAIFFDDPHASAVLPQTIPLLCRREPLKHLSHWVSEWRKHSYCCRAHFVPAGGPDIPRQKV